MSSEKQITANRVNARRSTGPKTTAGKARSRMNAWKHGLAAEKVVIPGEGVEQLKAIRRELWEEYEPLPGMESLLVERLAHYAWRMRRALVFEAALLEDGFDVPGRLAHSDGNALATLMRYEMACANASYRTLQQLLFLQDRRRSEKSGSRVIDAREPIEVAARLVNPPLAAE
jgi:hypothetical protein